MRFRVLGPIEVVGGDGAARAVSSPSQRRVLAALVARAGETVPADTLLDAVWGDDPPATAIATLRTYISRLRTLVGDTLATSGSGYRLLVEPADTDAGQFEALVDQATAAPPDHAVELLGEALALWQGPAYGDEADVAPVRDEARRLDERRGYAAEARARALLDAGRTSEAVAASEAVVARQPLREGAWAVLVEALARCDRAAEALRAFQRAAATLAEAGLEPSTRLRQVERAVLDGTLAAAPAPGSAPAPGPAAAPASASPTVPAAPPLPLPASSFIGRDADIGHLTALLDSARVVTLIGPGGVGKTRLALEVARVASQRRTLGARIVELAPLSAGDTVPAVVAALGLAGERAGEADPLGRAGALDALVVFDNAEHVIDDVAHTVERLVAGGPALRLLVTSRERLDVDGEHVWTVAPLSSVGAGAPGNRLFVERVRAAASDLELSPDDEQVARIVRRLDGLPLAIEMAAAQLATASLGELAVALEARLDALRSPRRDVAARHRSLAAVLAWSEERLSPGEATTLAELSVFAGPVAAADIEAVLGRDDAADQTRSLAARSLVSVDRSTTPVRFQLLFTVRDFAARKLVATGRDHELAARHAAWFAEVARRADQQLRTPDEAEAHRRLEETLAELRAAHRWARSHDPDLAAELSGHLQLWAYTRLLAEPLQWAATLLESGGADDAHLPMLLTGAAGLAVNRGDLVRARELSDQAIALAGRSTAALQALEVATDAAVYDGRLQDCLDGCKVLDELATELDERHYVVLAGFGAVLAASYAGGGELDPAGVAALDDLARHTAVSPSQLGWIAYARGELLADSDPEQAFACYEEARRRAQTAGNRYLDGVALVSSCALRARVGHIATALTSFAQVIRHWEQLGDQTHQITTLRNLVVLLGRAGQAEAAAELLGAVDRADVPTYGEEAARLERVRDWARDQLGEDRMAARVAVGARRDVPEAATWALDVVGALAAEPRSSGGLELQR